MGNKMKEDFENILDEILNTGKKFAIWGAGYEGHQCLNYMNRYTENKISPSFLVDNNKATWGKNGVISPEEFFNRKDEVEIVFICVYVADLVEAQIRAGGYEKKTLITLVSVLSKDSIKKIHEDNQDRLTKVRSLFYDKRSIDTLDSFIKVRDTGDISYFKDVNGDSNTKLIDKEILHFSDSESFIDVGAFIGDTINEFLKACNGKYKKIVGIEPEPGNYNLLKNYMRGLENAYPMGIACSDVAGESNFSSGSSESGSLDSGGDIKVLVKRMDEIDEAKDASFIKVSAIGRDYLVLKGAEGIIKNNRPKIAYYCFGELLWKIPIFLKEIVPEYKIYLRHYGFGMQAMVGYATVE